MRTQLLIAALILSGATTAHAGATRGLIVKQPPAVQAPVVVQPPVYQTQAAPQPANTQPADAPPPAAVEQTYSATQQPLESVALQPTTSEPAQDTAITGTHQPQAAAQPQASPQQMQMQQQQMQRQRMQQQRMQQAQRMRQQQMQQQQMQRQQMARNMSFEEKVDYKVKEVKMKMKEKLVGALFR